MQASSLVAKTKNMKEKNREWRTWRRPCRTHLWRPQPGLEGGS